MVPMVSMKDFRQEEKGCFSVLYGVIVTMLCHKRMICNQRVGSSSLSGGTTATALSTVDSKTTHEITRGCLWTFTLFQHIDWR
jgi:hypothetical protein